jgi:CBS domain-containing protein
VPYDRSRAVEAAQSILDQRGWCINEACVDIPRQRWEPRLVMFDLSAEAIADALESEIELEPEHDARLTGVDRRTLEPIPGIGAYLYYVADDPAAQPSRRPSGLVHPKPGGRPRMLVRDGMNPIVVTVGPKHTLREAARRMTARGVGAAVVIGDELPAPCIITERDILQSNGVGQSIDSERVGSHLTSELVYAHADWSLERAAATMVRGGFRHVIVLDGSDAVGILSMRDIVRCWTSDGASCQVPE